MHKKIGLLYERIRQKLTLHILLLLNCVAYAEVEIVKGF